jgi:hypothetical protein
MITILVGVAAFVAGTLFGVRVGTIGADIKADVAKVDTAAKTDLKKL